MIFMESLLPERLISVPSIAIQVGVSVMSKYAIMIRFGVFGRGRSVGPDHHQYNPTYFADLRNISNRRSVQ